MKNLGMKELLYIIILIGCLYTIHISNTEANQPANLTNEERNE